MPRKELPQKYQAPLQEFFLPSETPPLFDAKIISAKAIFINGAAKVKYQFGLSLVSQFHVFLYVSFLVLPFAMM